VLILFLFLFIFLFYFILFFLDLLSVNTDGCTVAEGREYVESSLKDPPKHFD
jgi:hypothetical protein